MWGKDKGKIKKLDMAFMNLEKEFDRVCREELWKVSVEFVAQ